MSEPQLYRPSDLGTLEHAVHRSVHAADIVRMIAEEMFRKQSHGLRISGEDSELMMFAIFQAVDLAVQAREAFRSMKLDPTSKINASINEKIGQP